MIKTNVSFGFCDNHMIWYCAHKKYGIINSSLTDYFFLCYIKRDTKYTSVTNYLLFTETVLSIYYGIAMGCFWLQRH